MPETPRELLRWQFDLTWSLFEYHLERLEPGDFLWEPGPLCWTVRRGEDGVWTPDWADTEPDPVPVPTVAWVTWHIGWWWSVTLDHLRGRTPRDREDVVWPGADEAVTWLRGLRTEWLEALDGLGTEDLDAPAPFPWPPGSGLTVAHTVAWVNAELMKNAAEIGQLRMLRATRT
ncbi:DinB family protein [Streptomonospora nanhaiensis]|uniref:DinB family protein n=1 Tax=Streptomonospora nanhaiensis TaxID=1323731 RepID=A0ABY6YTV6_9ACTN|nr:DinB family protein [Streptomonospora nanhaiensis]WAE75759.1 DinB family protein [Streptomonospora nanhaiensis]